MHPQLNPGDALTHFTEKDLRGWINVFTKRRMTSQRALDDAQKALDRDSAMLTALEGELARRNP